jgi:hypothetical protein
VGDRPPVRTPVDKPRVQGADPDIRYLELEEVEALLGGVRDGDLDHVERPMCLMAAMTGMRQGELLALRARHRLVSARPRCSSRNEIRSRPLSGSRWWEDQARCSRVRPAVGRAASAGPGWHLTAGSFAGSLVSDHARSRSPKRAVTVSECVGEPGSYVCSRSAVRASGTQGRYAMVTARSRAWPRGAGPRAHDVHPRQVRGWLSGRRSERS